MVMSRIVSLSKEGIGIPSHLKEEMGLKNGDRFLLYTEAGVVHLRRVNDSARMVKRRDSEDRDSEEFLRFVENWFLANLTGLEKRMTFQGNLSIMHLAEALFFLAMTKKTGVLILKHEEVTKRVYYENGEIVFAASSLNEERLGDILLLQGVMTEAQYRRSVALLEPGKRQGRVLVEMGVITPEDLWKVVCEQVESIIYSLFEWAQGYFEFLEGDLPTDERIKLAVSIPNLILEGMRRIKDPALIEPHLPEDARLLYRIVWDEEESGQVHLTREEKEMLAHVASGMTVKEACELSSLHLDEARSILFRLLSAGLLRSAKEKKAYVRAGEVEDSQSLIERIEQCNIIFRLITEYVRMAAGDRVHVVLGAFFDGIDHGQEILFENVSLQPDGSLDPNPLLANISEYLPQERESILIRGLNELLYFQLFAVRNNLGPEQEKQIISALKEMEFFK